MEPIEEDGVLEFCAGFPLVAVRRFSDDERSRMQSALRRAWLFLLLSFTPLPLVVLVFWLLSLIFSGSFPVGTVDSGFTLLVALAIPLSFILPAYAFGGVRRARRELLPNRVKQFRGKLDLSSGEDVLDLSSGDDAVRRTLIERDLLRFDTMEQSIDIIPATGRVLSVNGISPRPGLDAVIRTVASPVTSLATIPTINLPGSGSGVGSLAVSTRALNAAERRELAGHARRAWTPLVFPAAISTVWFVPLFILDFSRDMLLPGYHGDIGFFGFLAIFAFIADAALFAGLRKARQFGRDIRNGAVTISLSVGPAIAGSDRSSITAYDEFLPKSGKLWTASGSPARWRKIATDR